MTTTTSTDTVLPSVPSMQPVGLVGAALAPEPVAALSPARLPFDVAGPGEPRCTYQPDGMRCVRHPHPHEPNAHVRAVLAESDATPLADAAAAEPDVRPCTVTELRPGRAGHGPEATPHVA